MFDIEVDLVGDLRPLRSSPNRLSAEKGCDSDEKYSEKRPTEEHGWCGWRRPSELSRATGRRGEIGDRETAESNLDLDQLISLAPAFSSQSTVPAIQHLHLDSTILLRVDEEPQ